MKYIRLGYAMNRGLDVITKDHAMMLTHLNLAFGVIKDGLLSMEHLPDLARQLPRIRKMNPQLKIVLSIGGWGAGGFSTMCRTNAGRKAFAQSVKAILDEYQLDGVDIDWEYPCSDAACIDCDPSDRDNFTLLMESMRWAAGPERIVSIAAGGGDYFIRDTEMDKVAAICDYVQLMTYDLNCSSPVTRHHTSLYPMQASYPEGNAHYCTQIFRNAGVPLEKIILGAAFYSRQWQHVRNEGNGLLQPSDGIGSFGPGYASLEKDYINKNGFTRFWDPAARAPYLFDGSTFITYDDEQSIAEKCAYIKEHGLLGMMYWEHSHDPSGKLLSVIKNALNE